MTPEERIEFEKMQKDIEELKEFLPLTYRQKLRLDGALQNSNSYYVATGPSGPARKLLTFKDGILTDET